MAAAHGQTEVKDWEFRNKSIHVESTDYPQGCQDYPMAKRTVSSTNGAGNTQKKVKPLSHTIYKKLILNGSKT